MARLSSQADLGYVPFPAAHLVATYVSVPETARIFDPCAGEGTAIMTMANAWNVAPDRVYLNELHDERFAACQKTGAHCVNADALKQLQATRDGFQVGYMNPPFDYIGGEQGGGGRQEIAFWRRCVESGSGYGHWLQPGGIAILVAPQWVFESQPAINHLARSYDNISILVPPEELRQYGEWVVLGVVREQQRTYDDAKHVAQEIVQQPVELLLEQIMPRYHAPEPVPVKRVKWQSYAQTTPAQAQQDVLDHGGAFVSKKWQNKRRLLEGTKQMSSLFPLNPRQAVLRIADGAINGSEVRLLDEDVRIKGSTLMSKKEWIEHKETGGAIIDERHSVDVATPHIVTLGANGVIRRYVGDAGVGKLCQREGVMETLVGKVRESVPQRYDMQMTTDEARVLSSVVSASGRMLPGQDHSGALPMQMHVANAAVRCVTTPDPSWQNATPRAAFIAAEMGCGKTLMGILVLKLLFSLHPTNSQGRRAPTAIITAPLHLIGEMRQVERARKGKGEYPQWWAEVEDFWPGCYLQILESPHDLETFFSHAKRDRATPHIGFITNEKMKLSSGLAFGVEDRFASEVSKRMRFTARGQAQDDAERDYLEQLRKQERKARRAEAEYGAVAADEDAEAKAEREAKLKQSARDFALRRAINTKRWAEVTTRYGLCCPDCGRVWRNSKYEPGTLAQLKSKGLRAVKCEYCGCNLGQLAREMNNKADRALAIYDDERRRKQVLPWGTKPASNPRMALGPLIGQRYKGLVDVYICDEAHKTKASATAIGRSFGALVGAARRTICLTGTLYGGKASDVYALLLRTGNRPVLERYGWNNQQQFIDEVGVVDTISRTVQRLDDAGHFDGEPSSKTEKKERAGITARLAGIIQNVSCQVLLKHMGFKLPEYDEDVALLKLPPSIQMSYDDLEGAARKVVGRPGGQDALAAYLQATLCYAYMPWKPMAVVSKNTGEGTQGDEYPESTVLPHHEWLAEFCSNEIAAGRRVLVYAEHTNRMDIMPDIAAKVGRLAKEEYGVKLQFGILRSGQVPPGERLNWFAQQEREGTNVVLCNPRLVETGVNLIGWPSIVVLEPCYSLFTLAQAKRRAFRPTQTQACKVWYLGYTKTMSERAISIMGRKAAAAAILSGDDLDSGLLEFDSGMNLLQELRRSIQNKEDDLQNADVRAMFKQASAALKADLETGAADLGVELEIPEPMPEMPVRLDLPQREVVEVMAQPVLTKAEAAVDDEPARLHAQVEKLLGRTMPEQEPKPEPKAAAKPAAGAQLSMFDYEPPKVSGKKPKAQPPTSGSYRQSSLF